MSIAKIITNGYLDINKHPLKDEIKNLRECQSNLLNPDFNSVSKIIEISTNIISINNIINNKILLMLPERGDMSKISSFNELIDIHPMDGIARIKYTFDFELVNEKLSTFNTTFFDNTINTVTKHFEKISNLRIIKNNKDLSEDDLEIDKLDQVRLIKFELHIVELIRFLVAKKWNLDDSFSEVEHYKYDDIQLLKIKFLNNLIDNSCKMQDKEWSVNFIKLKSEIINKLSYLIKFLEVNKNLIHEILVNWKISSTNSRMYS